MHSGMLEKDFTTYTHKFDHSSVHHIYFYTIISKYI